MKPIAQLAGLAAAFLTGGGLTVLAVANAALHTPPIRRALREAAASAPGHSVSLGGTLLIPPFGCFVRNLSIRTSSPHGSELLEIPWARIRPDWTSLFRGRFVVREIVLERPHVTALLEEDRLHLPLLGTLSLSQEALSAPQPASPSPAAVPPPSAPVLPEPPPPDPPAAPAQNEVSAGQPVPSSTAQPPSSPKKRRSAALRIRDARFSILAPDSGLPPLCEITGIQVGLPTDPTGADRANGENLLSIRRIDLLGRTVARDLSSPIQQNAQNRLLLSGFRGQALGGELTGQFLLGLLDPGLPFLGTISFKEASLAAVAGLPPQWGLQSTQFEGVLEIQGLARQPASLSGQTLVRIIEEPPPGLPGGTLVRGRLHGRLSGGTFAVDDAYLASPRAEFRTSGFADLSGRLHFTVRAFFGEGGQSALEQARKQLSDPPSPLRWGRLEGRDDAYLDCIVSGGPQDLWTDLLGPPIPIDQALALLLGATDSPGGGFPRQDLQSGVSPPESR